MDRETVHNALVVVQNQLKAWEDDSHEKLMPPPMILATIIAISKCYPRLNARCDYERKKWEWLNENGYFDSYYAERESAGIYD